MVAPQSFIKALQHEPIACGAPACPGQVECVEVSQHQDRVKTYHVQCLLCGWEEQVRGYEELGQPWATAENLKRLSMSTCSTSNPSVLMIQLPLCLPNCPILGEGPGIVSPVITADVRLRLIGFPKIRSGNDRLFS